MKRDCAWNVMNAVVVANRPSYNAALLLKFLTEKKLKLPSRVVFEAEASGGGVRQVVSPTLPFPLSLPSPFPFPYILSLSMGGKVRSSEGEVPRLPPPLQIPPCCQDSELWKSAATGFADQTAATSLLYRATLCVSAVFAVGRCLSVRPSVCLSVSRVPRHCICTNASRGLSATAEFPAVCTVHLPTPRPPLFRLAASVSWCWS